MRKEFTMSDVFITYRRKDGWVMANLIYEKLIRLGYDVFLDTRNTDMQLDDYKKVIVSNVTGVKDHIVIITPQTFCISENDMYLFELGLTHNREDVRIIPVTCGNFEPSVYVQLENAGDERISSLANKTATEISDNAAAFPATFAGLASRLSSIPKKEQTVLKARGDIEDDFSLQKRWENAEEICICAYGIESILTEESQFFEQMLSNGVKFKILCVDPESETADYIANYNLREGREGKRRRVLRNGHELLIDYLEDFEYSKNIEYRLTTLHLESILMIVKKKADYISTVKADFVVTCNDSGDVKDNQLFSRSRRCAFIEEHDRDNYQYYCQVFDYLWDHSKTKEVTV